MTRSAPCLAVTVLLVGCAGHPPTQATSPPAPPALATPTPAPPAPATPTPVTQTPAAPSAQRPAATPTTRPDPFDPALCVAGNTLRVVLRGGRTMDGAFVELQSDVLVLGVAGGQIRLKRSQVERIEGRAPPAPFRARHSLPPPEPPPPSLSVMPVPLEAAGLLASLCWTADGASLLAVDRNGVVSKLHRGDFALEARVDLGRSALGLDVSSRGPVVLLTDPPAVVLLDPRTLATRSTVPLTGRVTCIASAPALALAFVGGTYMEDQLQVVDLKDDDVEVLRARQLPSEPDVKRHPRGLPLHSFEGLRATPDGRYLFCLSSETLGRLRIHDNGEVKLDETGPRIGPGRIEVSLDGRWVAMPTGGGNSGYDGAPRRGYSTFVYAVEDLVKVATLIESGHYPRALSFDPVAERFYAQSYDSPLLVFSAAGERMPLALPRSPRRALGDVRQLLASPCGYRVLVLGEKELLWVAVP